jgi:hypothetical protein
VTAADVLRTAAEVLAAAATPVSGPGLSLQLQQALQVGAGGEPGLYVAARDLLAVHLGQPVAAWALAGATTPDASWACHAAAGPDLRLISGSHP